MAQTNSDIKVYFITIPAHKFLHIRNYESIGYYDFWESRVTFPNRTAKLYADCLTVSRASSTIWAAMRRTAEAVR